MPQTIDPELFARLCRVYQHYYKTRYHTVLKASDFHIPWFVGRAKRKEEFLREYRGMSLAAFIEGIRINTVKIDGTPDKKLMDALTNKFSGGLESMIFRAYWDAIIKAAEANKDSSARPVVAAVSKLFMKRLYGPGTSEPNFDMLNSARYDMAVSFQIGSLMYEYYQSTKVVLTKFKKIDAEK